MPRAAVGLVDPRVRRHPQKVSSEGGGADGGAVGNLDLSVVDRGDVVRKPVEIEEVVETGSPGFYGDGEVLESADRLEESSGAAARHPQRHSPVEAGLRQQKRPPGVFAKAAAEEPAGFEAAPQRVNHAAGRSRQLRKRSCDERGCRARRRVGRSRKLNENRVVLSGGGNLRAGELFERRGQQEGQRIVLRAAPQRVTDDTAGRQRLVLGEVLQDDPSAVGEPDAGVFALREEKSGKLTRGGGRDGKAAPERPQRVGGFGRRRGLECFPGSGSVRGRDDRIGRLEKTEDALTQYPVAPHRLSAPEGDGGVGLARGLDEDLAVGDPRDAPRLIAEHEDLADATFPHELFVELADAGAVPGTAELVVAAVRDGAAGVIEQAGDAGAGGGDAADAIDGDPRFELSEASGAVLAREQVDDRVELLAGELGVGVDAANEVEELVEVAGFHGDHREKHLREHVEGLPHRRHGLYVAVNRRAGGHDGIEAVAAEERIHPRATYRPYLVTRAAGHLQAGGDRERRLCEDYLVDGADVDAELERGRGDDGLELPGPHLLLHERAHLTRERTVMRVGDTPSGPFIEKQGDSLRVATVGGEEQARSVARDDVGELRRQWSPGGLRFFGGRGIDGVHGNIENLVVGGLDDSHGSPAAHETRHDLEGANRGRERDTLELSRKTRESLHRGHEVNAPLGSGHGVHLVEDNRADIPEDAPSPTGAQKQVEAFRGCGEDLGRAAQHRPALALRGVSASRGGADLGGVGEPLRETGEGLGQVFAYVGVERLQGRDVEDRQTPGRPCAGEQTVERVEEGGERFAAARRRGNEHVLAGGDGRAARLLYLGGRAEALREPPCGFGVKTTPLTHSSCRSTDRLAPECR